MFSKLSLPTDHFRNMSVRMLSAIINPILMKSVLNSKNYVVSHNKESGVGALLALVNLVAQ